MNLTRAILLASLALFGAGTGRMQTPPPAERPAGEDSAAATSAAPVRQEAPAQAVSSERQTLSPSVSAALVRTMPKYNPPKPPEPKTEEEIAADQPRNQIIRLPQMVVEGERPPRLTEREMHTKEGLAELAMDRYLSNLDRGVLNRFTLPLIGMSNEERAMIMYEDAERQRRIQEARKTVYVLEQIDPEAAEQLKEETDDAYMRRSSFAPVSNRP